MIILLIRPECTRTILYPASCVAEQFLAAPEIESGAMKRRISAIVTDRPLIVFLLLVDFVIENNPNRGRVRGRGRKSVRTAELFTGFTLAGTHLPLRSQPRRAIDKFPWHPESFDSLGQELDLISQMELSC